MQETSGYQTNKFDLTARVEEGGWTVAWADDVTEKDAINGFVAAGVSIYSGNAAPFVEWVERLVDRTIYSLSANMQQQYRERAIELAREVISAAVRGRSAKEIARSMDTVDFKAGAIKYSGRNYLGGQTVSRTWGLKPYVAFRVRSSRPSAGGNHNYPTTSEQPSNQPNIGSIVCVENDVPGNVTYSYRWGNANLQQNTLPQGGGKLHWFSYQTLNANQAPLFFVVYDYDLAPGLQYRQYQLQSWSSTEKNCQRRGRKEVFRLDGSGRAIIMQAIDR